MTIRLFVGANMKIHPLAFNSYLLAVLLASGPALTGCKTPEERREAAEARQHKKDKSLLRLHLEVNADGTGRSHPVSIGRSSPFIVNTADEPFLDEGHIVKASLVPESLGGFQVLLQFDRRGSWLLEQYSNTSRGQRVAVFAAFNEKRWLGAPRLVRSITDGVFAFTPDATREEAERLVRGLNNVARKANSDKEW